MSTAFITSVSPKFFPVLKAHEGEVLRAYICPAGVWTIGVGLTAGSGVITPKSGMVITREQSRDLAMRAVNRNYAPRVRKHLPTRHQHVFDGATSFDFNTGRIHNASWVDHWRNGRKDAARSSFMQWVRGGGKVLPGLQRRRREEWDIIAHGKYPGGHADASLAGTLSQFADHAEDFKLLGFNPDKGREVEAIQAFQLKHGLTVDGLIGPATRAALIRAVEAKRGHQASAGGGAAGAATGGGTELSTNPDGLAEASVESLSVILGLGIGAAAAVFAGFLIWRYRGRVFAWLPEPVKDFFDDRGIVLGRRVRT